MKGSKKKTSKQKRSKNNSKKCPPGEILREGYYRKGHPRKSYTKEDGTKVEGSFVSRTYVSSHCVKDIGEPGKTPKEKQVLPEPDEKKLSPFGYSITKTEETRQKALKKASKHYGNPLYILRHLNLIRNYQPEGSRADKIMSKDVKFMSKYYKKWKGKHNIE